MGFAMTREAAYRDIAVRAIEALGAVADMTHGPNGAALGRRASGLMAAVAQVDCSLSEGQEARPLEAALDRITEQEAEICELTARLAEARA